MTQWQRVGEKSFLTTLDEHWREAIDARAALQRRLSRASSIRDLVLTETSLLVCTDEHPSLTSMFEEALLDAPTESAEHVIEVRYCGEDLAAVARELAISQHDIIDLHTSSELRVSFNGFLPGFAYLRGLHPTLASIPRRASPRPRVAARSVAIAAGMCAVYPAASPGGWQLLGEAVDFDPRVPLRPGDHVRFRATERLHVDHKENDAEPSSTHLRVERMRGIALIVDGEPRRLLSDGVPPGGPLLPHAAMRANAAVGNALECALVERVGEMTFSVSSASGPRRIANENGEVTTLRPGETITLLWRAPARVGYIAIEGGFDVPHVHGGRGTLLSVVAGGFRGRPLRSGDCVDLGVPSASQPTAPQSSVKEPFTLVPGPDFHGLSSRVTSLLSGNLKVAHSSDRAGTRLVTETHEAKDQHTTRGSTPLVRGCVQLTPKGELIVMGPDHPITGGYPLVGYVPPQQLEALFALPLGAPLQLALRDL